jgi:Fe-Mn family superoxide dismutase
LEELLQSVALLPDELKPVVKNHGWGHYNHSLFRQILTPDARQVSEQLLWLINSSFGSFGSFKEQFTANALANFGSGRTRLIQRYDELEIVNTPNQENPFMKWNHILLWIDLREHAYYLKHQQKRADYIASRWNVLNRTFVNSRVR